MYHLYLIRAGKENSECFFPVFLFEDLIKRVSARLEAENGPETKQEHGRQSGIAVHPVVEYYHCSYHVHVTWGTLHNIYPILSTLVLTIIISVWDTDGTARADCSRSVGHLTLRSVGSGDAARHRKGKEKKKKGKNGNNNNA